MPSRRRPASPRSIGTQWQQGIPPFWLYLVLILAVLLTYGRIVGHDFVAWDDDGHVTDNPHLDPISWQSVIRFWREPYFGVYVPVSYMLFTAEAWLAQTTPDENGKARFKPGVFHAVSLVLHLCCVLLAFQLLLQLLDHRLGACAGALLFALHPLQVESVAWISEQRGLLCGVFSLLAIWAYVKFRGGMSADRATELYPFQVAAVQAASGGVGYYLLATIACLLAILAKPSGAAVPLLAAALDLFLLRRAWRASLLCLSPWLVMAGAMYLVTSREQPGMQQYFLPPHWMRPLIAGDALQFYLTKLIWPVDLVIQYHRAPRDVLAGAWIYVAWVAPILVLAVCFHTRRSGPWMASAAWFVAALAPVLGLVPFVYQQYSTVADRYAYLALLAPALSVGWWIRCQPSVGRIAASAVVLVILAALSCQRAGHWRDSESLLLETLRVNPLSDAALLNWGAELLRRGQNQEALEHIERAFALNPATATTEKSYLNRALTLLRLGRMEEAIEMYEETLKRYPQSNDAHMILSAAYFEKQDWDKAIEHSLAGLALVPDNLPARFNLALALDRKGLADEAMSELSTVLQYSPNQFEAHMKLANLLTKRGEKSQALEHFAAGVQARGHDRSARFEYALALAAVGKDEQAVGQLRQLLRQPSSDGPLIASHAAWLLATREEGQSDALLLAEAACRQTQFQDPLALRALAAAQAAAGKAPEAEKTASLALDKSNSSQNRALAAALQADLEHYRAGQSIRDSRPLVPDAASP